MKRKRAVAPLSQAAVAELSVDGRQQPCAATEAAGLDTISAFDTVSSLDGIKADDTVVCKLSEIVAPESATARPAGEVAAEDRTEMSLSPDLETLAEQLGEDAAFLSGRYAPLGEWHSEPAAVDRLAALEEPRAWWCSRRAISAAVAASLAVGWVGTTAWQRSGEVGSVLPDAVSAVSATAPVSNVDHSNINNGRLAPAASRFDRDRPIVVRVANGKVQPVGWVQPVVLSATSDVTRWRASEGRPANVGDYLRTTPVTIPPNLLNDLSGPEQEGVLDLLEEQAPDLADVEM